MVALGSLNKPQTLLYKGERQTGGDADQRRLLLLLLLLLLLYLSSIAMHLYIIDRRLSSGFKMMLYCPQKS